MCQKILKNLLDAVYETVSDKPTGERILEKLQFIETQLEHQARVGLYLFQMTVGMSFVGLALGVTIASANYGWLSWILAIGGLLVMVFSGIQYRDDITVKKAIIGGVPSIVGLALTAIYLSVKPPLPLCVMIIGLVVMLIGFLNLLISKPVKEL